MGVPVLRGATWTTDAPFREIQDAIRSTRKRGLLAVEMEAAALYAFASARGKPVVWFAPVTNQMQQIAGDFAKGNRNGAADALAIVTRTVRCIDALGLAGRTRDACDQTLAVGRS